MKQYSNFNDIDKDLKILNLEREIAKEEMKMIKGEFQQSIRPAQWLQTGLKIAGKFGFMVLLKKIFR